MTTADEVALCEQIVDEFHTVGIGTHPVTNEFQPPFVSTLTKIVRRRAFNISGSGPSGYSDIYTDVYSDNLGSGSGGWVDVSRRCRQNRPTPKVAQTLPYDPTWTSRWVPFERRACTAKRVRTIESFLAVGETLYGDGKAQGKDGVDAGHDDSDILQACLDRALRFSHQFQFGPNIFPANYHLVVSLTRTYRCDTKLTFSPDQLIDPISAGIGKQQPLLSFELTGPGKLVRPRYNADGTIWYSRNGPDRINAHLKIYTDKTKLTSFTVDGPRPVTQDGGRNNDFEAQHAVWTIGANDVEIRNVTFQNYMGDGIAVAGTIADGGSDGIRVYGNRFVNGGRHCITPLGSNLHFYNNYFERNSSHICDLETSGSGQMYNHLYQNNRFHNCHGSGMRMPAFPVKGLGQCDAHGTFLRGCAWIENVRTTTNPATSAGAFDMIASTLDLGWQANVLTRNVTASATTLHGLRITSANFNLHVPDATWQGEERASISGPGIPTGSYVADVESATSLTFRNYDKISRTFGATSDGHITTGSTTVTSASIGFDATNVGATITCTGIPDNTYIVSVTNATTAVMSQAATQTSTTRLLHLNAGATATASVTVKLQCVAGPYGAPTDVGSDHASLGMHESADLFVIRNIWSRNGASAAMWQLGGDTPAGYQGTGHEGGPAGYNRVRFQYNYGPCINSVTTDSAFLNCTDQNDVHFVRSQIPALNPGMFV